MLSTCHLQVLKPEEMPAPDSDDERSEIQQMKDQIKLILTKQASQAVELAAVQCTNHNVEISNHNLQILLANALGVYPNLAVNVSLTAPLNPSNNF